jgi:hypothetical protein
MDLRLVFTYKALTFFLSAAVKVDENEDGWGGVGGKG